MVALARAGHELGNHLWSHADPEDQDVRPIREEFNRAAAAIMDASARGRPS